eukprot:CCRYP_014502-RB/>CCRYP_014502-RB protein AED:0.41 eAED:1.00 QI:0/0/0/1/0/0/2/0/338
MSSPSELALVCRCASTLAPACCVVTTVSGFNCRVSVCRRLVIASNKDTSISEFTLSSVCSISSPSIVSSDDVDMSPLPPFCKSGVGPPPESSGELSILIKRPMKDGISLPKPGCSKVSLCLGCNPGTKYSSRYRFSMKAVVSVMYSCRVVSVSIIRIESGRYLSKPRGCSNSIWYLVLSADNATGPRAAKDTIIIAKLIRAKNGKTNIRNRIKPMEEVPSKRYVWDSSIRYCLRRFGAGLRPLRRMLCREDMIVLSKVSPVVVADDAVASISGDFSLGCLNGVSGEAPSSVPRFAAVDNSATAPLLHDPPTVKTAFCCSEPRMLAPAPAFTWWDVAPS